MADEAHDAEPDREPAPEEERTAREPPPAREFVGTGVFWATLVILVFVAAIVAIVVQNTSDVRFEFLWLDITTPLLTVILFTSLISVVVVETATALWRLRRRHALREREELQRLRGAAGQGRRGRH